LKYIFLIITIVSFSITKIYNTPSYKTTEVTITIPELTNVEMIKHLENELNKEKTVEYVASSLLTNTIVLKVNDNTFSKSKIDGILHKWGCNAKEYYYKKISDFNLN
tara:strand:+ start:926 stop:1246 length:321 start_codon:yes stop_codon:yes gene_type:complete